MFRPAAMTRARIIFHKKCFDSVLSALQDIGVMQIETLPEKMLSLLGSVQEIDYKKISDYAQRFRGLESQLYPRGSDRKFSFESIEQLTEQADGVAVDERVAQIRKNLDEINANVKDAEYRLALLGEINDFKSDLSVLNTKNIASFVVRGQQLKQLEEAAVKKSEIILTIPLAKATIFSMKKGDEKEFSTMTERFKVRIESMPQMDGTVAENRHDLGLDLSSLKEKSKKLEDELENISEIYYPLVSALKEQLDIEMEKYEIVSRLGIGTSVVIVEGWVPSESMKRLEKLLKEITENRYILERVKTKDQPPTLMHNPVTTRLYEFFVRFYSIPKSGEIDPTMMFALAFPIFFGFMVGDVGYGLVMLGLSLFIIHRINHPPKVSHLPKMITGFIGQLVSRNSLKLLAKSIIPGAIIAIVLGVFFNEWFGFQLPYTTPFNVEVNLSTLLVVAGWIGVFMVCFGFFLGFLNKLAEGDRKHAVAKIGWLAAAIGFVIFGLNVLHGAPLGINNTIALVSYIFLVGGVITILRCEGAMGMMEIPSLISHILSYTRLVGILLASVILAGVVDLIFVGGWHHSILLGIVGTVILIVGQLFNIIIALFEPGIQGARLIYVEFFSKFYEGNGRLFKPFSAQRNRTLTRFKI